MSEFLSKKPKHYTSFSYISTLEAFSNQKSYCLSFPSFRTQERLKCQNRRWKLFSVLVYCVYNLLLADTPKSESQDLLCTEIQIYTFFYVWFWWRGYMVYGILVSYWCSYVWASITIITNQSDRQRVLK